MAHELPDGLRSGLDRLLDGVSRTDLARRAAAISNHYRSGGASAAILSERADAIAYLVTRLPATFAATSAVLDEVRARAPAFAPRSVLDVGAGPGTASWAATGIWPIVGTVTMVDGNRPFLDVAGELAAASDHPALRTSRRVVAEMSGRDLPPADLVVAGFALAEIAEQHVAETVAALWRAAVGMLVLVEPGTPSGFARILSARSTLIAAGARILAPCPHAAACPIVPPDWCHFAVRLPRLRDHKLVKGATVPFEDEKFSYVAVGRDLGRDSPAAARILSPPRLGKAELRLRLCTAEGIVERSAARRDRDAFANLRRARWGDGLGDDGRLL